jgi:hypothetical protein
VQLEKFAWRGSDTGGTVGLAVFPTVLKIGGFRHWMLGLSAEAPRRALMRERAWFSLIATALVACGSSSNSGTPMSPPVAPVITRSPAAQTVAAGRTASFTVQATGTAPLAYQWQKNGQSISGAAAATYVTPPTVAADNGARFSVVVSNSAGSASSGAAVLTVTTITAPAIAGQPTAQSVVVGQTATFTVQASGTAPLTYQWTKNGQKISGATSAGYITPPTTSSDNGAKYSVVVSNSAGSATSSAALLTVTAAPTPPVIIQSPAAQTVAAGQAATFTVQATGTSPLMYQWKKNGQNISGATAATYVTPPTATSDNGTAFSVVVSNSVGSATSGAALLTVTAPTPPVITQPPAAQTVTAGQTATFTVRATGTAPLMYQWKKNGQNISGAVMATYITPPTTTSDNGATFVVVVTNAAGSATSSAAVLTVTAAVAGADVLTYHNDNARTAQNLGETVLTPAVVNSAHFGLLRMLATDGLVDAQPLIVSNLTVLGKVRNVIYVVTEHDSVYSFDADDGTPLAKVSLLGSGESTSDNHGCSQVTPEIGITSTPVVDRNVGAHGTLYTIAMSKNGGTYYQRLHALDLLTLGEQTHSPVVIQATYPGTGDNSSGGKVIFDPSTYKERVGLLALNGTIFTAWASHCDYGMYTGWILGYDELTLAQTRVLNVVPNGSKGAIWQSGGGLAADAAGHIYALVANGTLDTTLNAQGFPSQGDYGNGYIKMASASPMQVVDYFAEDNDVSESTNDIDLGSGAPMLLPDLKDGAGTVRHLAVGAGKDGHLYVVNRDNMGKFNASNNKNIWQDLVNALPGGIWSAPAYFNGSVYYADVRGTLKAFAVTNALVGSVPASQSTMTFAYPGASPSVSANGSSNGIVWAVESATGQTAVLHAFDAGNLANTLYSSNDPAIGLRDRFGTGNKFITPTIANGKVYVGTPNGVAVFGLLP